MLQYISQLTSFAIKLVSDLGYPGIVLVMALENVFPPIPSEAVMPLAGFLVTTGRFNFILAVTMGVLGSLLGGLILYYLGAIIGSQKVRGFIEMYGKYLMISAEDLNAAEQWFNRHGERAVLLARMVPVVRSVISIPAGFIKMPLSRFIIYSTIGIACWTTLLTVVGVVLGNNWEKLSPVLRSFDFIVVGVLLVLLAYYVFKKTKKQENKKAI